MAQLQQTRYEVSKMNHKEVKHKLAKNYIFGVYFLSIILGSWLTYIFVFIYPFERVTLMFGLNMNGLVLGLILTCATVVLIHGLIEFFFDLNRGESHGQES